MLVREDWSGCYREGNSDDADDGVAKSVENDEGNDINKDVTIHNVNDFYDDVTTKVSELRLIGIIGMFVILPLIYW